MSEERVTGLPLHEGRQPNQSTLTLTEIDNFPYYHGGLALGDWREYVDEEEGAFALRLNELSQTLINTVLKYGKPDFVEWIQQDKTFPPYIRPVIGEDQKYPATIGWKAHFQEQEGKK